MSASGYNNDLPLYLTKFLASQRKLPDGERVGFALGELHNSGLLNGRFIRRAVGSRPDAPRMFSILVALGRGDLSIARLYEGHVNALQLIAKFGTSEQLARVEEIASAGGLLGVWGADDPTDPAVIMPTAGGYRLKGRKTFASGADRVTLALVAAKTSGKETQLVLLVRSALDERFDPSWWRPLGMQATNSFALDLEGIAIGPGELVGGPGDYEAQPFFGAGSIRFVSAQLGGALAVWDATRSHLAPSRRFADAHQSARLGQMVAELEGAFSSVKNSYVRAANAIGWDTIPDHDDDNLSADAARVIVEGVSERVIAHAIRSVGCAGLMDCHPLSFALRDLMVYLRQPAPDATVTRLGTHAATGKYRPAFDET